MKNNLLKSVIILLAVTFVTLQSCEKKSLINSEKINVKTHNSENEKNLQPNSKYLTSIGITYVVS